MPGPGLQPHDAASMMGEGVFELRFPAREIGELANRFGSVQETRLLEVGAAVRARGHYASGVHRGLRLEDPSQQAEGREQQ